MADRKGTAGGVADRDDSGPGFRGVAQLALDAKGRVAIPAKHREQLANGEASVVVTADPSGCLLVYPRAVWEPKQLQLMQLPSFDVTSRRLQRLLVGHAQDVDIDAAGRILVPPALREYAHLDKLVVLVGQGRKFELWDATAWQQETAQAITTPATGLPPGLDGFSL